MSQTSSICIIGEFLNSVDDPAQCVHIYPSYLGILTLCQNNFWNNGWQKESGIIPE